MPSTPPTLTALLLAASTASAAITIPTVSVGNAGNDADDTGYGAVDYDYRIGTYEVTNSQYTAFLNAVAVDDDPNGLFNSNMEDGNDGGILQNSDFSYTPKPGMANKPVNHVSFWDAARFVNWLTNGQPTGSQDNSTTETGAYTLTTDGIDNNTVTRGSWYDENKGNTSSETVFAVPSEDEWYKAAYYRGDGLYYDYPTDFFPAPNPVSPENAFGSNNANYENAVGTVTEVGAYPNSPSYYGTFDQGGNIFEFNDAIIGGNRGLRGGSFDSDGVTLKSSDRLSTNPPLELFSSLGFRVSRLAPIPEPSSYGAIFGIVGLATAVFFRRRRRRE